MMDKLSRRKLAEYVAERLNQGAISGDLLAQIAAYLIESRRTREAELIVRAIEDALQERGVVVGTVATAHPLTARERDTVKRLIDAESLHLTEEIDESLIGGVKVSLPDSRFDGTIKHTITALRGTKV